MLRILAQNEVEVAWSGFNFADPLGAGVAAISGGTERYEAVAAITLDRSRPAPGCRERTLPSVCGC